MAVPGVACNVCATWGAGPAHIFSLQRGETAMSGDCQQGWKSMWKIFIVNESFSKFSNESYTASDATFSGTLSTGPQSNSGVLNQPPRGHNILRHCFCLWVIEVHYLFWVLSVSLRNDLIYSLHCFWRKTPWRTGMKVIQKVTYVQWGEISIQTLFLWFNILPVCMSTSECLLSLYL